MMKPITNQPADIMQSLQNLINENENQKKEIEKIRHDFRDVAYQMAEMAVQLRTLSEKLTTMAQTVNGAPLSHIESLRAKPLDEVECTRPARELTQAQIAGYARRRENNERRKEEERLAAEEAQRQAELQARKEARSQAARERRLKYLDEHPEVREQLSNRMKVLGKSRKKSA